MPNRLDANCEVIKIVGSGKRDVIATGIPYLEAMNVALRYATDSLFRDRGNGLGGGQLHYRDMGDGFSHVRGKLFPKQKDDVITFQVKSV